MWNELDGWLMFPRGTIVAVLPNLYASDRGVQGWVITEGYEPVHDFGADQEECLT